MGLQPKLCFGLDQDGAANISAVTIAMLAIEAGEIDVALVCYADNPKTGSRAHYGCPRGQDAGFGWLSAAAGYAMIHRRHQIE